jgi:hypothetical protein
MTNRGERTREFYVQRANAFYKGGKMADSEDVLVGEDNLGKMYWVHEKEISPDDPVRKQVRKIASLKVNMLRKQMLNYDPFYENYSDRIEKEPLYDLVKLVRNEMRMRGIQLAHGSGMEMFKNYMNLVMLHKKALNFAQEAGLIRNFDDAFHEDRRELETETNTGWKEPVTA